MSKCSLSPLQKFGGQSVAQIEHMRCRHRIRVLQGHEDTTKQNVVSRGHLRTTAPGGRGRPELGLLLPPDRRVTAFGFFLH